MTRTYARWLAGIEVVGSHFWSVNLMVTRMRADIPHEIDIPRDHPGSTDHRKRVVSIHYREPTVSQQEFEAGASIEAASRRRVHVTISSSVELALFLFRNTKPRAGIVDGNDHGPYAETDPKEVGRKLRDKHGIVPPWRETPPNDPGKQCSLDTYR